MVKEVKIQFLQNSHIEYTVSLDTKLQSAIYEKASSLIDKGSTVMDLGCGDCSFIEKLIKEKNVNPVGIEISSEGVVKCLSKGITVFQSDIDKGLEDYKDNQFDYITSISTLQMLYNPELVINEMLRVGKRVVVSFPNYGFWKNRVNMLLGRTPVYRGTSWFSTPNIHNVTINDFIGFCDNNNIFIERVFYFTPKGKALNEVSLKNIVSSDALFQISKKEENG